MTNADEIPAVILDRLRQVCLALPETIEEAAWTGVRWRVRTKTFAHVLRVADGWPPVYASSMDTDDPSIVVTFQAEDPAFFRHAGERDLHYFGFGRDTVGTTLRKHTEWTVVREWLTDSYRLLAPRHLVARLDQDR